MKYSKRHARFMILNTEDRDFWRARARMSTPYPGLSKPRVVDWVRNQINDNVLTVAGITYESWAMRPHSVY